VYVNIHTNYEFDINGALGLIRGQLVRVEHPTHKPSCAYMPLGATAATATALALAGVYFAI
jgi:hypothetical protein